MLLGALRNRPFAMPCKSSSKCDGLAATALYGGCIGLLNAVMAYGVITIRRGEGIGSGDGGNALLQRYAHHLHTHARVDTRSSPPLDPSLRTTHAALRDARHPILYPVMRGGQYRRFHEHGCVVSVGGGTHVVRSLPKVDEWRIESGIRRWPCGNCASRHRPCLHAVQSHHTIRTLGGSAGTGTSSSGGPWGCFSLP